MAAVIVTVHCVGVPTTGMHPFQPPKFDEAVGDAVSVTTVPVTIAPEQFAATSAPAHETLPLPDPVLLTVKANLGMVNVAVTVVAAFMVRLHWVGVPAMTMQPLQLPTVAGAVGVAVSVTNVPLMMGSEQFSTTPVPAHDTAPVPVPVFFTVRLNVGGAKVAVTDVAAVIVTVHFVKAPLTGVHPLHPSKVDGDFGTAVNVTTVPFAIVPVQLAATAVPAQVTFPLPAPALLTVRANVGLVKVAVTVVAALTVTVH